MAAVKPQDTNAIEDVLHLLSPRWTTAVLIELSTGKKRTTELIRALSPISAKTLTERLTTLRKAGFVKRTAFKQVPPKVEYGLTKEGAELLDLLKNIKAVSRKMSEEELHNWGNPLLRQGNSVLP